MFRKNPLWPYDMSATDIDLAFYKNLPHIAIDESMKSYIKMFPLHLAADWTPYKPGIDFDSVMELVSEWIDTEEEAIHFSKAVEKHCFGIARPVGHTVYGCFHLYSICSYWRNDIMGFEFANWA